LSRAASVAILPSALFGERLSFGASWVFSFQSFRAFGPRNRMKNKGIGLSPLYSVLVFSTQWCCCLRIDLSSHRFGGSRAPGLSRSHLDSAVELGSSYSILRHGSYGFTVLIFFIAGLLSIAS
jgi:hypothetical protein